MKNKSQEHKMSKFPNFNKKKSNIEHRLFKYGIHFVFKLFLFSVDVFYTVADKCLSVCKFSEETQSNDRKQLLIILMLN